MATQQQPKPITYRANYLSRDLGLRERVAELHEIERLSAELHATALIKIDVEYMPSEDVIRDTLAEVAEQNPWAAKLLQNNILKRRLKQHTVGSITVYTTEDGQAYLLITKPKSAKDIAHMEFDTQRIIEQAVAAGTIPPENPTHPEPDTIATLETTATEATRLHDALTELRERGVPLTADEAELAVAGLHEIAARNEQTARELALHALERRMVSQTKIAELLGVSQMTVSRWHRDGLNEASGDNTRNLRA